MESSVVHSTHRGSSIAYQSRTDNARAHADMKNTLLKRPICNARYCCALHRKGYNICLQDLFGIDIITPGASTVDHVQDFDVENLLDSMCREHSVDKRLSYVIIDSLPTHCPLISEKEHPLFLSSA